MCGKEVWSFTIFPHIHKQAFPQNYSTYIKDAKQPSDSLNHPPTTIATKMEAYHLDHCVKGHHLIFYHMLCSTYMRVKIHSSLIIAQFVVINHLRMQVIDKNNVKINKCTQFFNSNSTVKALYQQRCEGAVPTAP